MAGEDEKIELEGFKNQTLTAAGAARMSTPSGGRSASKKVVALQLDARQQLAFALLGGADALRELLAPPGLCLKCRKQPAREDSPLGAYCNSCAPVPDPLG